MSLDLFRQDDPGRFLWRPIRDVSTARNDFLGAGKSPPISGGDILNVLSSDIEVKVGMSYNRLNHHP